MKTITFDETLLNHPDQIAQQLFFQDDDPSSLTYKRILVRPTIRWATILRNCLVFCLLTGLLCFVLTQIGLGHLPAVLVTLSVGVIAILCCAKSIIICLIRIYQRYAPDTVRNKCRFEPSCSQYMILALEQYGLRKGLQKGLARLKRCTPPNGGYDLP